LSQLAAGRVIRKLLEARDCLDYPHETVGVFLPILLHHTLCEYFGALTQARV
jgi:hypothetical protein